jgi:hypothetical protein
MKTPPSLISLHGWNVTMFKCLKTGQNILNGDTVRIIRVGT